MNILYFLWGSFLTGSTRPLSHISSEQCQKTDCAILISVSGHIEHVWMQITLFSLELVTITLMYGAVEPTVVSKTYQTTF